MSLTGQLGRSDSQPGNLVADLSPGRIPLNVGIASGASGIAITAATAVILATAASSASGALVLAPALVIKSDGSTSAATLVTAPTLLASDQGSGVSGASLASPITPINLGLPSYGFVSQAGTLLSRPGNIVAGLMPVPLQAKASSVANLSLSVLTQISLTAAASTTDTGTALFPSATLYPGARIFPGMSALAIGTSGIVNDVVAIGMVDSFTRAVITSRLVSDALNEADAVTRSLNTPRSVTDSAQYTDALSILRNLKLTDSASYQDSVSITVTKRRRSSRVRPIIRSNRLRPTRISTELTLNNRR